MQNTSLDIEELRDWIEFRADRSSGPGGQSVNKVNTRVTLLFDFEACTLLADPRKARIRRRLATRLARDGRVRVASQRERSQHANRRAAEQRLIELLDGALYVPKARRKTRPSAASRRRRLDDKRRRGQTKRQRQRKPSLDD